MLTVRTEFQRLITEGVVALSLDSIRHNHPLITNAGRISQAPTIRTEQRGAVVKQIVGMLVLTIHDHAPLATFVSGIAEMLAVRAESQRVSLNVVTRSPA